jgi:hypothetical protein
VEPDLAAHVDVIHHDLPGDPVQGTHVVLAFDLRDVGLYGVIACAGQALRE